VSDWRDYPGEMPPLREIDDVTAEAVLRGDDVPAHLEPLVTAIAALRATPEQPVRPSAELAARMAAGDFASAAAPPRSRRSAGRYVAHTARHRGARRKLATLPVRVKVAAAVAFAAGGLATATAAGALPEPAQQRMQSVIESVTPIDFPEPADFGREIADDARDGGVDGRDVSEKARQLGTKPDQAGDRPAPPAKTDRPPTGDVPADSRPTAGPPGNEVPANPPRPKVPDVTPAPPVGGPAEPPGRPDRPGIPEPPDPQHDRPVAPPATD
jgi:hypothetical protein